MARSLQLALILSLLALFATAQQKTAAPHSAAKSSTAKSADATNLPSEDEVKSFLQQMLGYDSSLSWSINSIKPSEAQGIAEVDVTVSAPQGAQGWKFYIAPDGKHAINGEIVPFGPHPFDEARRTLQKSINGPSKGPATAPVTLVEFSDLECPHCKDTQPTLDRLASEDKNVRIVFQNYPLPMHDWAAKAAAYADCVGRSSPDAFWKFVTSVYGAQSDITPSNADEKLTAFADAAGVKGSDMAACAAKPETTSRVEKSVDLGKSLDVNSTPTIFINGRKLAAGGVPYEALQKLVDFAAQQK